MKLKIMDYSNKLEEVELPDNVSRIMVTVISGDEILTFSTEDGREGEVEHSTRAQCHMDFFDGKYEIFNKETGIDRIEAWNKREDTYDFM